MRYVTLPNGDRILWRELLRLRREQQKAERQPQPTLFEVKEDRRPETQRSVDGRYSQPLLFEK